MKLKVGSYKLLKTVIRITKTKNLLKPVYYTFQDLIDGNVLKKNISLKNIYQNHRCFILGTGSSLKETELALLANEYTFGSNLIFKHKDFQKLNLKFYALVDPFLDLCIDVFINRTAANLNPIILYPEISKALPNPDTLIFLHTSARRFIEKHKIFKRRKVYYVNSSSPMELATAQSNDLSKRITFMNGSIFFMIAAAIYMGFKELYLSGCDYTYQPRQSGHFYEDWTLLDDKPVEHIHQITKVFADEQGVEIYNVTPDGFESPIYEKISWDEVVSKTLTDK